FPEGALDEVHYAAGLKEVCLNATLLCIVVDLEGDLEFQLSTLRDQLEGMGAERPAMLVGTHADAAAPDMKGLRALSTGEPVFGFPLGEGEERAVAEALCGLIGRIVVDARDPVSKEEPLAYAVPEGASVLDLTRLIHKDLTKKARRARVWGPSSSFDGQEVGLDHVLSPGDTVEIVTR
ncbi:MAG: TGS domain-containing protein, partial [Candidatus Eisenbacteria sp.]|nr:TGS domain-containing protein [Candidatus Eisenbacteria bacterium]